MKSAPKKIFSFTFVNGQGYDISNKYIEMSDEMVSVPKLFLPADITPQ